MVGRMPLPKMKSADPQPRLKIGDVARLVAFLRQQSVPGKAGLTRLGAPPVNIVSTRGQM